MPVPDYQSCMLPLLEFAADGEEHTRREAIEALASRFELTPPERAELLPSAGDRLFDNRVSWAQFYLKKAGLLESPRRATFRITAHGAAALSERPARIDVKFLERFPEFRAFREKPPNGEPSAISIPEAPSSTPEEALEAAYQAIRQSLSQELLVRVLRGSPAFFEKLVVELLVKMGYGGSRRDAGERLGQAGDGGVDGIIKEDRLGLDAIYVQAKRWQAAVGRPEIQKFVGALHGQRARKGVFITTSTFTREAVEYVSQIETKVVLIDGEKLASLMIDFDVGVSVAVAYALKRIDSDYFDED